MLIFISFDLLSVVAAFALDSPVDPTHSMKRISVSASVTLETNLTLTEVHC